MAQLSDQYVYASSELLQEGHSIDTVLTGLRTTMQARRHDSLYPLVLRKLQRTLPNQLQSSTPQITLRDQSELAHYQDSIESALKALAAPAEYNTRYDDSIIGGTVIQYKSTRIDNSYKHTLKNLYKNIITS